MIGYFYIKRRGKGRIARAFIPTITDAVDGADTPPADEAEDQKS